MFVFICSSIVVTWEGLYTSVPFLSSSFVSILEMFNTIKESESTTCHKSRSCKTIVTMNKVAVQFFSPLALRKRKGEKKQKELRIRIYEEAGYFQKWLISKLAILHVMPISCKHVYPAFLTSEKPGKFYISRQKKFFSLVPDSTESQKIDFCAD